MRHCLLALFSILVFTATATAAEDDRLSLELRDAARLESAAFSALPFQRWEVEEVRGAARNIHSLPDELATRLLWMAATAPASVDITTIFANALNSPSPVVRRFAASLLAGGISPESKRFLLNTLASERDTSIVGTIVDGMAHLPLPKAVTSLMDVMFLPGLDQHVVVIAAKELRRLTQAELDDNASSWRDWWLDNENRYNSLPR